MKETFKIHNHTSFSQAELQKLKFIGMTVNNWRRRNIALYQHPTKEDYVVSVGTTFDCTMVVITEETKDDWHQALDYIAHGKVYVRE